jgi:hypothetical protein
MFDCLTVKLLSTQKKSAQMCFNSKRFPIDSIKMSITILESMSEQMFVLNDKLNQQGFPIFLLPVFKDRFLILYRIPFYLGF